MKIAQRLLVSTAAVVALLALAGCGKPDPVNESHSGELAAGDSQHPHDNSFYDEYTFKAGEGYTITVTMQSTAFDSYLQILKPDGELLAENDDMAAGNLNAQVIAQAPTTGEYKVLANSRNAGETGAYTVTIQTAAAAGN